MTQDKMVRRFNPPNTIPATLKNMTGIRKEPAKVARASKAHNPISNFVKVFISFFLLRAMKEATKRGT